MTGMYPIYAALYDDPARILVAIEEMWKQIPQSWRDRANMFADANDPACMAMAEEAGRIFGAIPPQEWYWISAALELRFAEIQVAKGERFTPIKYLAEAALILRCRTLCGYLTAETTR